jgi:hypothetical protein
MPPENTPPESGTELDGGTDTTDADAETFASEWLEYKTKVDTIHGFFSDLMKSEPDKPHIYFRPLFTKKFK